MKFQLYLKFANSVWLYYVYHHTYAYQYHIRKFNKMVPYVYLNFFLRRAMGPQNYEDLIYTIISLPKVTVNVLSINLHSFKLNIDKVI